MKPIPFQIPKATDSSLQVQVDEAESFYDRLHQHPEWQITAIHRGKGVLFAGNSSTPFREGDVFILGSNTPHLLKNEKIVTEGIQAGICSVSLFFHDSSLGPAFFALPELHTIKTFLLRSQRGITFQGDDKVLLHEKISSCTSLKGFQLILEFLSILEKMANSPRRQYINAETYQPLSNEKKDSRINQVISYSIQHLSEDISLHEIATVASLSVSQFCRYFKLHTKKTYIQFLNELRIETACSHLHMHDYTIERISFEVGFHNLSNFNRQFKKIKGMSPSVYRTQVSL